MRQLAYTMASNQSVSAFQGHMTRSLATDYTPRAANFVVTLRFGVLRASGSRFSLARPVYVSRILETPKPAEDLHRARSPLAKLRALNET